MGYEPGIPCVDRDEVCFLLNVDATRVRVGATGFNAPGLQGSVRYLGYLYVTDGPQYNGSLQRPILGGSAAVCPDLGVVMVTQRGPGTEVSRRIYAVIRRDD